MSHVISIDVVVTDLKALREAAEACGLEFLEGQKSYKWWGHHVGDYPLPKGFTKDELGKCEHALAVKGNGNAYEIGVAKSKSGKGYELLFDFYGTQGRAVERCVGKGALRLVDHYGARMSANLLRKKGYRVNIQEKEGEVIATCTK